MKSVLISIRPKWCELIASGKKTIEVRKSYPKIETPFKCYIYCTNSNTKDPHKILELHRLDGKIVKLNGKVIGEFVCDEIYNLVYLPDEYSGKFGGEFEEMICKNSCLSYEQIMHYKGNGNAYGWHISDLKIYDKPKELSEFNRPCKNSDLLCFYCDRAITSDDGYVSCNSAIVRPPQSWMFVEELQDV